MLEVAREFRAKEKAAKRALANAAVLAASMRDKAAELPYCPDPVRFFREFLGIEPWSKQVEILEAVRNNRRVSVRSGHKVSKSNSAAGVALWWFATKPQGRVIMTSSSARQVKDVLWYELKQRIIAAPWKGFGQPHDAPDSGLVAIDGRQILGFSTNEPERMAGYSGANLLYIVDEASGVPEPIFAAIEGNLAGGAYILLLSNPTQTVGTFYESHTTKRSLWKTIHISSEDTPNVKEGRSVIPGLATREWVEEKKVDWGEESPLYQVRVQGNFPTQTENQVIGLALVEAGTKDWRFPVVGDGDLEFGVDVARFGDDQTVIYPRRGKLMYPPTVLRSMDGPTVAGRIMQLVRLMRARVDVDGAFVTERPRVKVDVIGVGASVYDALKEHHTEMVRVAINVSESAPDETYSNLRAQLWFAARDWLKEGGMMQADSLLEAELIAPQYGFDARSRVKVWPKDEIKKKLKRSPDRADAFCLAIYNPPVGYVGTLEVDWMSR